MILKINFRTIAACSHSTTSIFVFSLVIFISGGGGVEELENYQEIFAEMEGEQRFWQTVDPAIIIILFYLFFAYTLRRTPIKNSTAATVIGLVKRVYVQSALKNRRYYTYVLIIHLGCRYYMVCCSHSPSLHRRPRIYYILYYIVYGVYTWRII